MLNPLIELYVLARTPVCSQVPIVPLNSQLIRKPFSISVIYILTMCVSLCVPQSTLQRSPTVSRNSPPVAEAVQWARQLLARVEQPMQFFRDNSTVMKSLVNNKINA